MHQSSKNTYHHATIAQQAFCVFKISRMFFLVCIDEYQVKWSRGGREGLDSFFSWAEDNVDLVDEARGGEVLRCHFDAIGVYVQSGDRTVLRNSASEPSR